MPVAKKVKKKVVKTLIPVPREKRVGIYWDALKEVLDPELSVGIVDLGLVYDIKVKKGALVVILTFTSMGCPAGPEIIRMVEGALDTLPGIQSIRIDVVWEPVWGQDMVNPDIAATLF